MSAPGKLEELSEKCRGVARFTPAHTQAAANQAQATARHRRYATRHSKLDELIECVAHGADRAESGSYDMAGTPKAKGDKPWRGRNVSMLSRAAWKVQEITESGSHRSPSLSGMALIWPTL